jgi:peptidoglycan/LPS O-acetylase OafA/YrhL
MPPGAYTAVDLFFLMSGFVIAQAYEGRIRTTGLRPFLRARLVRLYPTYLLSLLILPAYCAASFVRHGVWVVPPGDILASLGASLFFLPSHLPWTRLWDEKLLFPLNGPAWSLMLEMAVNLAYALALPWLSRRALVFIVLASGALLVAADLHLQGLDLGWGWPTLGWGVPRVAFSFFLGVLVQRTKLAAPAVPPVLVLAAVPLLFYAPPILAILLGYPLLLIAATRAGAPASRVMAAMGALSYPLYALHFPLLHWTGWLLAGRLPAWGSIPASVALVLAGAWLALELWDEPVRRRLSVRAAAHRMEPLHREES